MLSPWREGLPLLQRRAGERQTRGLAEDRPAALRPLAEGTAPLTVTMDQPAKTPKTAEREQPHSWSAVTQLRAVTLHRAPKFPAAASQRV